MIAVSVFVSFFVAGENLVEDAVVASGVEPDVTRPALELVFRTRSETRSDTHMKKAKIRMIEVI